MMTPQLECLTAHCERLPLHHVAAELSTILEQATKRDVSYTDFLDDVLAREVAAKQEKHQAMRVMMARFPFQKSLESFNWKFQPSIERKVIKELTSGWFIADGKDVLLLGPPGVGKTHLAVALGMSAYALALRTMFTTAAGLITTLGKALYENRLEERLKVLTQPKLLIIDEIGYIPIDRQGANLFFQLISRRYERGSILVTSNQSLGAWGEVFGDPVIASAILGPAAASRDDNQHQGRLVSAEGETARRATPPRRGVPIGGVTRWGI